MQTCLTQPEILLGKGMPWGIGKVFFGQIRGKYQSLSLVAFHSLIVPSFLLSSPFPPPLPHDIQMEKLYFEGIYRKKVFGNR